MLGPSGVLSIGDAAKWVFNQQSLYILETVSNFGLMFFLFLVGVKMDMGMVRKAGRKGIIIGLSSFLVPMFITHIVGSIMLYTYARTHRKIAKMFGFVAVSSCETSFHVIVCLLADLKLLNTEMGRLAMSSSMITNTLVAFTTAVFKAAYDYQRTSTSNLFTLRVGSFVITIVIVVYVMYPIMLWMIERTPGSKVREVYVFVIFLMVLVTALFGQVTGQLVVFGPIVLGLAVPVGPPLGTTIETKLEPIVQSVLLPLFYVECAGRVKFSDITSINFLLVELLLLVGFLGKLIGCVLSSLYCEMPLEDALTLGLIMVSQGFVDLIHFRRKLVHRMINIEVYSIMTCTAVVLSGITSPLLKYIYKPSRRYMACKRFIDQSLQNSEFRILACVYYESNAPTIINLLQASNPTSNSPICLYLLHLIELERVTIPILIAHKKHEENSIHYNRSKLIINAFKFLEGQNISTFSLNSFTSMSPYGTMHDDICSLATDKRTSLIILPFHRHLNMDGLFETTYPIRNVNQTVLPMAPCTVGILVDRGRNRANGCIAGTASLYNVAILFLGGPDDREVLTYGMRMAEYPYSTLTVFHFCSANDKYTSTSIDSQLDIELMNQFRMKMEGNEKMKYREEVVKDGIGIIKWLKLMDGSYDLVMVGRQHDRGSPLVQGLIEWNEFPELGFIGDVLATSDSFNSISILVLQRQFYTDILHSPDVVLTL